MGTWEFDLLSFLFGFGAALILVAIGSSRWTHR